jgi:hypothetical protein
MTKNIYKSKARWQGAFFGAVLAHLATLVYITILINQ